MRRLLIVFLLLASAVSAPMAARAQAGDLETGFYLGRYSATALSVAYELVYLESLIDEVKPEAITDEAINSDTTDAQMAQHALVYTVWRVQFFLDPMIEDANSSDSFAHPALAPMREPTVAALNGVKAARDAFMDAETTDLTALAKFNQALKDGGYVNKLMELAAQAADAAGVSDAGEGEAAPEQ